MNPTKEIAYYLKSHASNNLTKSILAVATPQYAEQIRSLASKFPNLQIVSACVDTVGYGIQRNGLSWCVFEKRLEIKDRIKFQTNTNQRNWTQNAAVLRMTAGENTDFAVPLASTLFHNGEETTLIDNNQNYKGLHVVLPASLSVQRGYRPLVALTENMRISSCKDNMLKAINNQAAASFLERATQLIDPKTQSRTVFAQINNDYFKVTAGGGGLWSPRTRMLVLDTAAAPKVGDEIKFWLSTDTELDQDQKSKLQSTYNEYEATANGIVLEVAPIQQSLDEEALLELGKQAYLPVFGMGSEQGIFVNETHHQVVGETIHIA